MHWKSSLLPISPQDTNTANKDCKKDKNINIAIDASSCSIEIPYDGLYGFILGKRNSQSKSQQSKVNNGSSSSAINNMANLEARILDKHTTKATTTYTDTGDDDVNASNHTKKVNTPKMKLSKQMNKMPLYCGCTFQAIFYRCTDKSDNHEQIDITRKKSIMIPFTSQIVHPLKCNMSTESNDVKLLKVLSSPYVARMISIKKKTTVTMQYIKHCERDDCDIFSWEWGLISHCISTPQKQKNDDDESANRTVKTQEKGTNDEPIQLPNEKRARYDDGIDDDGTFVDFFPKEATKKPLLCSVCSRKFPNIDSIYKHCIIAHIDTIAIKGTQEYIDLVGPPIIRKPLLAAFEDDHLVIVVKHQGLIVQGGKWTLGKSDLLMPFRCKDKNITDALSKPRAVHRLDGATGGLLVVAKTHSSEVALKKCFAERSCRKRYRAIVFGRLEGGIINDNDMSGGDGVDPPCTLDIEYKDDYLARGIINSPIGGKESTTYYYVVSYTRCLHEQANGWISTVDLFPVSGRQHQLRRHMKLVGHPIFGDRRYGSYEKSHFNHDAITEENQIDDCRTVIDHPHSKLCLWALEIDFNHPATEESVNVKIEEPQWYKDLRHDQDKKWCHSHRQG